MISLVRRNILPWFECMDGLECTRLPKKVYLSDVKGRRGCDRLKAKCREEVRVYVKEGGNI